MIDRLPFDIWMTISSHLTVRSILNLACTCKLLSTLMDERSVWALALGDILEVIPLRAVRAAIPSMSSRALKAAAVRATLIDNLFNKDVIHPVHVKRVRCDSSVVRQEIVPGGQWILIMHEDGSINLHKMSSLTSPLLSVARPDCASSFLWNTGSPQYVLISTSRDGVDQLVLASESYTDAGGHAFARFVVYHFNIHTPSFRILTSVTRPDQCSDFTLKEGLLIIGWEENGSYLLDIRKVPLSPDEGQGVLLNLGPNMASPNLMTTILCPHRFLVSVAQRIFIYAVPELSPLCEGIPLQIIDVTPLAVHEQSNTDDHKWLQHNLCSHHTENRLSTVAESANGGFDVIILPSAGQPTETLVRYAIGTCDFGPSRAIWSKVPSFSMDEIELRSCALFTHADTHVGYMRLGRSKAPNPSRCSSIPIAGNTGRIRDLAWDEQSGIICISVSLWDGEREVMDLVVVELIQGL